jgi:NAD dependent epimerase/dehydratase
MKVLVTGAAGFIASHLTELLLEAGYHVRALVHYNSNGTWGHLNRIPKRLRNNLEVKLGDITDPYLMRDAVLDCDLVLHLAALIGVPYSYVAPASYVATNVGGTVNLLEACRNARVRRVVVASTSEVYGTALYTPMDEKHPLRGQSPYAASKIAADKFAESFYLSFGLPVVILRPFNTYGPRQSARAVIPTILGQAINGATKIQLGNLNAQRDLTFVEDTAKAFVLAATTKGIEGETIHFGAGSAMSIGAVARLCLQVTGRQAEIVSVQQRWRPESSEVDLLLCDPSKAKILLGWNPHVSLEDGVRRTAEYMQGHLNDYRPGDYII